MTRRLLIALGGLVALALVAGVSAWQGYRTGYGYADALGRAALADLVSAHDRAYAEAVADLQAQIQAQTERALSISYTLDTERKNHAETQATLHRQIAAATRDSRHVFSADFVRLWNQAVGAGCGAVPGAGDPACAVGAAGAGQTAGGRDLGADVTEADVLAWITYYGARTRGLESQVNAWIDLAKDLR